MCTMHASLATRCQLVGGGWVPGVNKFQQVQCIMGNDHIPVDRRTYTSENITFPQLRWREVKIFKHIYIVVSLHIMTESVYDSSDEDGVHFIGWEFRSTQIVPQLISPSRHVHDLLLTYHLKQKL